MGLLELAESELENTALLAGLEAGPVRLDGETLCSVHLRLRASTTLATTQFCDLLTVLLVVLDRTLRAAVESRCADLLGKVVVSTLPCVRTVDCVLDRRRDEEVLDIKLRPLTLRPLEVAVLAAGNGETLCGSEAETEADHSGHATRETRAVNLGGVEFAIGVHGVAPAADVIRDRTLGCEDHGVAALALAARTAEEALEVGVVLHADTVEEDARVFVVETLGSVEHVLEEDDGVLFGGFLEEVVDVLARVDGGRVGLRTRLGLGLSIADVLLDAALVEKALDLIERGGLSGLARGARAEEVLAWGGVEVLHEPDELVHRCSFVEFADVFNVLEATLFCELLNRELLCSHAEADDV